MAVLKQQHKAAVAELERIHADKIAAMPKDATGTLANRDREAEARIKALEREVAAGAAARQRVLDEYNELLSRQQGLAAERGRLTEMLASRERQLDALRERAITAGDQAPGCRARPGRRGARGG